MLAIKMLNENNSQLLPYYLINHFTKGNYIIQRDKDLFQIISTLAL